MCKMCACIHALVLHFVFSTCVHIELSMCAIVVTTGIKPSSNIGNALVSAMYGRSSELGLYLWGNRPLPTVQEHPPLVSGGWLPHGG